MFQPQIETAQQLREAFPFDQIPPYPLRDRNGHPKARHYLGSALTVAASALAGRITDPRTLLAR